MYFFAKPMESSTYLDHHYFIILNSSTEIPHSGQFKITPGNAIFFKRGIPQFLTFEVKTMIFGVSTYVLKYKEVIQMIRNNITTFLNTTNSRWPP